MTMIEKMARAMAAKHACFFAPDDLVSLCIPYAPASMALIARGMHKKLDDGAYMPFWEIFVPEARAAIEVMREPTMQMVSAGNEEIPAVVHDGFENAGMIPRDVWRAMFDKALSE